MQSRVACEHFVTVFDSNYLPMGLALHASLHRHANAFRLWVVCVDAACHETLVRLDLPGLVPLPLVEVENEALCAVKSCRNRGEYCWTLTPFAFDAVFERDPAAERVTYVDADVWFLRSPAELLGQLGKGSVLVTEHGFPEPHRHYWEARSGRFCVQFLTMTRDPSAGRIRTWWQERCLDWCSARWQDGRFGDQLYLDQWPEMLGDRLRIVSPAALCQGPWNTLASWPVARPVLYHFHEFRFMRPGEVQLVLRHRLGPALQEVYPFYIREIGRTVAKLREMGVTGPWDSFQRAASLRERARQVWFSLIGRRLVVPYET